MRSTRLLPLVIATLSMATMRSPGRMPATNAGDPGKTIADDGLVRLVAGNAECQRRDEQDQVTQNEVRDRPGKMIARRLPRRLRLKVVVGALAARRETRAAASASDTLFVLALHRAVAADRQGAQRVLRAARGLVQLASFGPKPTANSLTRTPLRRASTKWPSSCSTISTESITRKVMTFPIPTRVMTASTLVTRRPFDSCDEFFGGLASRADRRLARPSSVGLAALGADPCAFDDHGNLPKAILPSTNAFDGDFVCGREDRRHRPRRSERLVGQADAREASGVGRLEVVPQGSVAVTAAPEIQSGSRWARRFRAGVYDRRRDRRSAYPMGRRMSGAASCAFDAAVGKNDEAVGDRLRMNDESHPLARNAEQAAGFDDFQPLVHHGGRVDRIFRAHPPGRMREGGGEAGAFHLVSRSSPEGAARRGQDDRRDARRRLHRPDIERSRCARCRPAAACEPLRRAAATADRRPPRSALCWPPRSRCRVRPRQTPHRTRPLRRSRQARRPARCRRHRASARSGRRLRRRDDRRRKAALAARAIRRCARRPARRRRNGPRMPADHVERLRADRARSSPKSRHACAALM